MKFYAEIEYRFPEPETDKDRRECDEAEILVRNAIANLLTQNLLVGNRAMSVVVPLMVNWMPVCAASVEQ